MDDEMFEQAKGAASVGGTAEEIADRLNMSVPTLEARLKERGYLNFLEFRKKHFAAGKLSLRRRQLLAAQEGNPTMLIWLGKNWLGQSDKINLDAKIDATVDVGGVDKLREFLAPKSSGTTEGPADE
jgi:hypothetical protein